MPPAASEPRLPASVLPALQALAAPGLALVVLAACMVVLPSPGERLEWNAYLALGTVLPAGVLLIAAPFGRWQRAQQGTAMALGFTFVLLCGALIILSWTSVSAAAFAMLTLLPSVWRAHHATGKRGSAWPAFLLVYAPVTVAAWIAAERFLWWTTVGSWGWRALGASAAIVAVTALQLFAPSARLPRVRPRAIGGAVDAFAIGLLALASVRADRLFTPHALHHWAFIAGPAQLVREGGWLLWDVPSQYGFLSTLAIAALPVRDVWQATYVLDSALLFLSAAFVYALIRASSPSLLRRAFALLATLAAVFLVPGEVATRSGPQEYPSTGALRFFWCYAVLAVLVWAYRHDAVPTRHARILVAGSIVWLAGTLWSFESAIYCAAIWLPAYAILVWRWMPRAGVAPSGTALRVRATWWLLPPTLLASAAGLIHLVYATALGHAPDWWAAAEYSASYAAGFAALPVEASGPVAVLLLVFCALTAVVGCALRGALRSATLAPAVGAWATAWATASYFVGRSAASSATNITSVFCVGALVALSLLRNVDADSTCAMLARLLLVPFLAAVIIAGYVEPATLRPFGAALRAGYAYRLSARLPEADAELAGLRAAAGVRLDDAIIAITRYPVPTFDGGAGSAPRSRHATAWLPALPFALLTPISESRRRTYVRRFLGRRFVSGWLLVPRQPDDVLGDTAWIYDELARTHDASRRFGSAEWSLIRYEDRRRAANGGSGRGQTR